jgi:hypothetical protein
VSEAVSKLFDEVSEWILAQFPDARIRGRIHDDLSGRLVVEIGDPKADLYTIPEEATA